MTFRSEARRLAACLCLVCLGSNPVHADEGLWLPFLLKQHEQTLVSLGLKIPVGSLFSNDTTSLKDAVVLFGGGCTGELISGSGLVLTNHHCGYGNIRRLSTVQNNYVENGYWAMEPAAELPCPGLSVTFVRSATDVTDTVLQVIAGISEETSRNEKLGTVSAFLEERAVAGTHQEAAVVSFYEGNRFYLFVTETFTDIRLVGAPPASVGNFGGDTDNWMWPRHTGDFSLFRIYAGPDNKPAKHGEANVPYRPRHHFPVSLQGVREGDFTMVYGFPGRTRQFAASRLVDLVEKRIDPARIAVRGRRMQLIADGYGLSDTTRFIYEPKHKQLSNSWKKWQGEAGGLRRLQTAANKRAEERLYHERLKALGKPELAEAVHELDSAYLRLEEPYLAYIYYAEAIRGVDLFALARGFRQLFEANPGEGDEAAKVLAARHDAVNGFFSWYEPRIDRRMFEVMLRIYTDHVDNRYVPAMLRAGVADDGHATYADRIFKNSVFTSAKSLHALLDRYPKTKRKLAGDPVYRLAMALDGVFRDSILGPLRRLLGEIDIIERRYLTGRLLLDGDTSLYPDANSTLRLSYGRVQGYAPRNGVRYRYYTTLSGIMEKEDADDPEFIVDRKLKALYREKDYGPYSDGDVMPVAFIATNHTSGGNSGSPVIDGEGRLVGINFDRVWEGTMSDYDFDPERCRNIAVDIRYVLFVVDKMAGCSRLLDEMTIIR